MPSPSTDDVRPHPVTAPDQMMQRHDALLSRIRQVISQHGKWRDMPPLLDDLDAVRREYQSHCERHAATRDAAARPGWVGVLVV